MQNISAEGNTKRQRAKPSACSQLKNSGPSLSSAVARAVSLDCQAISIPVPGVSPTESEAESEDKDNDESKHDAGAGASAEVPSR